MQLVEVEDDNLLNEGPEPDGSIAYDTPPEIQLQSLEFKGNANQPCLPDDPLDVRKILPTAAVQPD